MKNVFIVGINGKMGKTLCACAADHDFTVTGGFDAVRSSGDIPVFCDAHDVNVDYDIIIDFSYPCPETLHAVTYLAQKKQCPAVIATTGFCAEGLAEIEALSKRVPVFRSANMSLGIAAAKAAAVTAKKILGDSFDIEIVEKHHSQKADSPSGTAILLADALNDVNGKVIANRQGKRGRNEIGISSVRGGTVVGEHEIGFYGDDEIVTISHSARSRKLFAAGAFKAAEFLFNKAPGLYDMDDLVNAAL